MPIFKNKIFIIATIIILLTVVATGFIFYSNYRRNKNIEQSFLIEKNQELEKIKKARADYEVARQASVLKDDNKCRSLEGKAKDDCFYKIANDYLEKKYCDEIIDDESKKRCQDIFIYNNIIKTGDDQQCFSLQTDFYKNNCLEYFFSKIENLNDCEKFNTENKIRCRDIVNKKNAYTENSLDMCNDIGDEFMKNDCRQIIKSKPKDSDGDGLADSEELSYGSNAFKADTDDDGLNDLDELSKYFTDPKNPDTDGDGHTDGEEIRNGFNPGGTGKLQ
jgi:hypothetical protein